MFLQPPEHRELKTILLSMAVAACLPFASVARANGRPGAAPESVTAQIDHLFDEAWRSAGVVPGALTDDATFLRRATLDLTGLIPTVGETRIFLADSRPDKRQLAIAGLLQRPRHSN